MANDENFEWLDETGKPGYKKVDLDAIAGTIEGKAAQFIKKAVDNAVKYKLVNTGDLTSEEDGRGYRYEISKENGLTTLEVFIVFYGLFQDKGVQGFKKQDNAPDSPYKFRHGKMSKEGLLNLRLMISEGRAKVMSKTVGPYKREGFETKAKAETGDPLDREARTLAYFIKAYGIKTRPFFTEAFNEVFGGFEMDLQEGVKREIIARLKSLNNQ